jgi:hypothetical protein
MHILVEPTRVDRIREVQRCNRQAATPMRAARRTVSTAAGAPSDQEVIAQVMT